MYVLRIGLTIFFMKIGRLEITNFLLEICTQIQLNVFIKKIIFTLIKNCSIGGDGQSTSELI